MRQLEELEQQFNRKMKVNTILVLGLIVCGCTALLPLWNQRTKYDQIKFCFDPEVVQKPDQNKYCIGSKIRVGISWIVEKERSDNIEFATKVKFIGLIKAASPQTIWYGLGGSFSLLLAWGLFQSQTDELEKQFPLVFGNLRSHSIEIDLENEKHLGIVDHTKQEESRVVKDKITRQAQEEIDSEKSEDEIMLDHINGKLQGELAMKSHELQLSTLDKQIAENKLAVERLECDRSKLNKPTTNQTAIADKKAELLQTLKDHEGGWLHDMVIGRMPIIIYGKQGAYKSYSAACLALLKAYFQDARLVSICDPHAHQNRDESWRYLILMEPEIYGAHEDWDEYAQGINDAFERWSDRTLKDAPIISIWDELTTMGVKLPGLAPELMPKIISAPRKANDNTICITHSLTNAGLGGVEGMSQAIADGTLRLKLKANALQQPLFKGVLSGWVDGEGNEIDELPVTLPEWFRPEKLVEIF